MLRPRMWLINNVSRRRRRVNINNSPFFNGINNIVILASFARHCVNPPPDMIANS